MIDEIDGQAEVNFRARMAAIGNAVDVFRRAVDQIPADGKTVPLCTRSLRHLAEAMAAAAEATRAAAIAEQDDQDDLT